MIKEKRVKRNLLNCLQSSSIVFLLILFFSTTTIANADSSIKTTIYGRGCLSCLITYTDELKPALKEIGIINIEIKYLESDLNAVEELNSLHSKLGVPQELQRNIIISFDEKFVFEGTIQPGIIVDFLLNNNDRYQSLVVSQDELRSYTIIDSTGFFKECDIQSSVFECIPPKPISLVSTLMLIIVSGLLDGINPCAFAVLLFFLSLLFLSSVKDPSQQLRKNILFTGAIYIFAVFLAYLAIGLALIKIIAITPIPHIIARIGIIIMMFLGLLDLKDYFYPDKGPSLGISISQWKIIRKHMHKFTLTGTFLTGLAVALFEFPCTGGIYISILGLLASETNFFEGFIYLIIYNMAFILPMIVILAVVSNKNVMRFSLTKWKMKGQKIGKLISGLVMISLGVLLLIWVF